MLPVFIYSILAAFNTMLSMLLRTDVHNNGTGTEFTCWKDHGPWSLPFHTEDHGKICHLHQFLYISINKWYFYLLNIWVYTRLCYLFSLSRRLVVMTIPIWSCVHDPLTTFSNEDTIFPWKSRRHVSSVP